MLNTKYKYSPPGYPFDQDVSLDFWTRLCSDVFGSEFNNERLGRGIPLNVTNVFFVFGSSDPWHSLAITEDTAASSRGMLIDGADHWDFMFLGGVNETVNERVKSARDQVKMYLSKVLEIQ